MGRRPDSVATQAAKGNSGRRKSAVAAREAKRKAAAAALIEAAQALDAAGVPEALRPNSRAAEVFARLAPHLRRTHRLDDQDLETFAILCTLLAEWQEMEEQVQEHGRWQMIPHHANPKILKAIPHPAKRARDEAFKQLMVLVPKFGLTPDDRFQMFKNQQMAAALNPDLFGEGVPDRPQKDAADKAADEPGLIGALGRFDAPPPGASVQ